MRGRVLLVDDDVFVKEILSLMLASSEFDVIEAEDGKEAVELFFDKKPDVVLMDIVMPKMGGIDATKEILKIEPGAVILAITAFAPRKGKEMLEAGAKEIISKPITRGKLVEIIRKYLK
ncbi:MAG: response regulator [Methermicoccaceae archaeon]